MAPRMNFSTSCFVLPACKETRKRPVGTVGGVIGLVLMPSVRRCAERDQGIEVITGIIGHGGNEVFSSVRWEGSERRSEGMAASLGRKNEIKWEETSKSLVESCEQNQILGMKEKRWVSPYEPFHPPSSQRHNQWR